LGIIVMCLVGLIIIGKVQLDKDIASIEAANAKLDETIKELKLINEMLGGK
jgi:hypothetical protein